MQIVHQNTQFVEYKCIFALVVNCVLLGDIKKKCLYTACFAPWSFTLSKNFLSDAIVTVSDPSNGAPRQSPTTAPTRLPCKRDKHFAEAAILVLLHCLNVTIYEPHRIQAQVLAGCLPVPMWSKSRQGNKGIQFLAKGSTPSSSVIQIMLFLSGQIRTGSVLDLDVDV